MERIESFARAHWKRVAGYILAVLWPFVFIFLLVALSLPGIILPPGTNNPFSVNAIVATSNTLLTVEGFLLALSPLLEHRARPFPLATGIFAVTSSVVTINVGLALTGLQTQYGVTKYTVTTPILGVTEFQYFTITIFSFIFMLVVYSISLLTSGRQADPRKSDEAIEQDI